MRACVASAAAVATAAGCFSSQTPPPDMPDAAGDLDASLDATVDAPDETANEAMVDAGPDATTSITDGATPDATPEAATEAGLAAGTPIWFRTTTFVADAGTNTSSTNFVAADPAGNVYVAISFTGTIDFGTGPVTSTGNNEPMVIKYDPNGNVVWSYQVAGGTSSTQIEGMAVDANGGVGLVIQGGPSINFGDGGQTGAMFAVKLDPSGHVAWANAYNAVFFLGDTTGYYNVQDVALTAAGDMAIGGYLYQPVNLGAGTVTPIGSTDAFVLVLGPNGQYRFAKHWGVAGKNSQVNSVAFQPSGDVALAGNLDSVAFDLGGGSLAPIGVDDYYFNADGFVMVLDTSGNYVTAQRFGGAGASTTANMVTSNAAGLAIGGTFSGTTLTWGDAGQLDVPGDGGLRLYVAQLDPNGVELWSHAYGDPTGWLQFGGIAATTSGNPVVTGFFDKGIDFGDHAIGVTSDASTPYKAFVAELDRGDGGPVFSRATNNGPTATGSAYAWGVAAGGGGIYVGGWFGGTIDFGGMPETGNQAFFVAKFAQ
jgi:hypothetical protein